MSMEPREFEVAMTCDGCANAVRRVLGKLGDQVSDLEINVEGKRVKFNSTKTKEELLEILKKTGKECKIVA